MSDELRRSANAGGNSEQLLWITGCVVGAAHPPSPPAAEAMAWYALEQAVETCSSEIAVRSRHR